MPLDSDTNFAIVQGLQQNGVKMKSNVLATGYSQDLLDQPIVDTITPNDVMFTAYRPVELGGKAVKKFRADLKKYAGITGVPDYGTYTGYIVCDMTIKGLQAAGKDLTRDSFVEGVRGTRQVRRCRSHLRTDRRELGELPEGHPDELHVVRGRQGRQVQGAQRGQVGSGKLVGDPALIEQYSGAEPHPRPRPRLHPS